jgi:transcriptional regulator with XRE-family HTH domain
MAHELDYRPAVPTKTAAELLKENLAKLRETSKLPQGQRAFQARTGVKESTLGRARRGEPTIQLNNLMDIARAYRIDTWRLLAEELGMTMPTTAVDRKEQRIRQAVATLGSDVPKELKDEVRELLRAWLAMPEWERHEFKEEIIKASLQHRMRLEKDVTSEGRVVKLKKKKPPHSAGQKAPDSKKAPDGNG